MWWTSLLLTCHLVYAQDFSWTRTPGPVHACLGGDAVFPWDYDTTRYPNTVSLEWHFLRTSNTILAADGIGGRLTVREWYFPEIYGDRAYRMDPAKVFAGLLLKNVSRYDEGRYRVTVGGYSNIRNESDLSIHTQASLKPNLLVDNEPAEFDSEVNKTGEAHVTVTVSTDGNLVANITIIAGDNRENCTNKIICSLVVPLDVVRLPTITIRFLLDYSICEPQDLALDVLTGASPGDINNTTPTDAAPPPPGTKFHLWYIAIIVLLVIIIIILVFVVIWISLRRRERKGETLKPLERKFANWSVIDGPMSFIAKSTVWKDGQPSQSPSKQNGGGPSDVREEIPLVERRPSPLNRLGPGNGHTLFINLAKTKGLTEPTINFLLEDDFENEKALATMEEDFLQSMDIPDEQKESLRRWLHELMSSSHGSSESKENSTLTRHRKTPSTPLSGSGSGDFSIEECLRNLQMCEKNERDIREYVLEKGVQGLESFLRDKLNLYMKCPVNIAVTGRSGTGKSSLINTLRGLRARDKGAAAVGVTETTLELEPYNHPEIDNVLFWDLPGVNTPKFPRATYLTDVEFHRYDAFMIACTERLTQDDMWLAKEAAKLGTPFYFLRTKIDVDIESNKRDGDGNEKYLLYRIRTQIQENLAKDELPGDRVYLISNVLKNRRKWDFPKLARDLVVRTPERNKFAMVMAMVTCSREIIALKKDDLRSRITTVALTAALSEGDHEQIIKDEINLYTECFGVNDANMKGIDMAKMNARLKDIKGMLDSIMNQEVEESVKGREVGKYFLGVGYFVGMIIDEAVNKARRAEAAKHKKEFVQITGQAAKEVIVEEALFILEVVLERCQDLALAVLEQRQYLDT